MFKISFVSELAEPHKKSRTCPDLARHERTLWFSWFRSRFCVFRRSRSFPNLSASAFNLCI